MPPSPLPRREAAVGRPADGRPRLPRIRVGTDVIAIARIEELTLADPGFREQVFTAREWAYCRRRRHPGVHLAARFAAKEAVLKALGTGMGPRMEWTDIEVVNDVAGRPRARLYGEVAATATRLGMQQLDISMTHSAGLAMAQALLVCTPEGENES
ncbi:holo-[acyl-carrier-protein] synthase [Streptomyces montanus]|uniref:Holo-[acyl-carrier-protein] synthase n=1 Tax=Streptomyces montanus TaxID=2580423 RepID=A0A5R9FTH6_9ACTN|nr:holo-ACP synthase [Streptomyces montanus]TLS47342.1 holo-[acyl-carrier-protein] synthase [Streptomyces montanus]